MEPVYFESPEHFRSWLARHHDSTSEVWVGYYKKGTGHPSLTWPESVDEALCFGWIDGIRRSIDGERYTIRFTPRKRGSNWSAVNLKRAEELIRSGRMQPPGLRVYESRDPRKSSSYSFEQRATPQLPPEYEARFRAVPEAWVFWEAQPPGYRRTATWWVLSAKRQETRERRLATLIADSAAGLRVGVLRRPEDR